ncbi:MAG: carbohydrate binding family 9 domain-containing protein [Bacteroidetes bacterium]|nr:carbohydrate binding family 9 domain-containing protein [Bacteroidota bacterium]
MRINLLTIIIFLNCFRLSAGNVDDTSIVRKILSTKRAEVAPKIDGKLDDDAWKDAEVAGDFIQYSPVEKAAVSFPTDVRILYDDQAIYLGAMCYDNNPDSIKRQLGTRDDYLNADNFIVRFDTYNTQQDAFTFSVSASGVQGDSRLSDYSFNAVWESEVKILSNGWSVEMKIPWSALRFPTSHEQIWGLQLARNIQRKFEYDQWAQTPKEKANSMKYWGLLKGLTDIKEPVRLSVTPYLTTIWQKDSRFGETNPSMSLSGGMNLKYGINESFTLDMTLLPDFSQVKSDNIVKNLGPFEIQYQDQRPFFTEGTDLFTRGDIFYSRRIGRTPSNFYSAPYLTDSNEVIIKNPSQSHLLNATKLSGRTNGGLGIGLLNAYVDNTYAIAKDTLTGKTRNILTEPSSNYNIFVFDQQLKNSSDVFITNTNVIRSHGFRSANVTASGFVLNNKKNTWGVVGAGGVSNVMTPTGSVGEFTSKIGYYYNAGIYKNGGKFQYGINRQEVNKQWDCNDMGINRETNYSNNNIDFSYNIFNPWKCFNNAFFNASATYSDNLTTGIMTGFNIDMFSNATLKNFWNVYLGGEFNPVKERDFYEPRVDGRFYLRPRLFYTFAGINTNENKKLSLGFNFHGGSTEQISTTIPPNPFFGIGTTLFFRAGNRFTLSLSSDYSDDNGDRGWVETESDGTIVFGRRELRTVENSFSTSFVFMKDMSISFIARHYWETGNYLGYYVLNNDGTLTDYVNYTGDHNFSFNSASVDMVYRWIFAPGSTLSISWKQNVLNEQAMIDYNYFNNFNSTVKAPQFNQVSLSLLYYLDYNSVAHKRRAQK